jgi:transposase
MRCDIPGTSLRRSLNRFGPSGKYDTSSRRQRPPSKRIASSTVLKTGLRWNHLPTVLGFGSGATCWRRLNDWRKAGVWDRLHELLLDKLRGAGQIDLSYAAVKRIALVTCRFGSGFVYVAPLPPAISVRSRV